MKPQQNVFAEFDDRRFRDALADVGIGYWVTVCTFFDPVAINRNEACRPIGANGQAMQQEDWYLGIAPSNTAYVREKTEKICQAVEALRPDGVFLSFTRWPGFWERWLPDKKSSQFTEYSYDQETLQQFMNYAKADLPSLEPAKAASWINSNKREVWNNYKCDTVYQVIRNIRSEIHKIQAKTPLMLNTLPFNDGGFDHALQNYFGQRTAQLCEVIDIFEVMTYHQILRQGVNWIGKMGSLVKAQTQKPVVCTLQMRPHYLDGMHKADHRAKEIPMSEMIDAARSVKQAELDGFVVFIWEFMLQEALINGNLERINQIKRILTEDKI
jgi:hypothetical protein